MSTRTPLLGLTIPAADGSDSPGEWPTISGQGLIDLEDTILIASDSKTNTDTSASWPRGVSVMGVTPTGSGGWPVTSGLVMTIRRPSDATVYQFLFSGANVALTAPVVVSGRLGTGAGWSPWRQFLSASTPTAVATGQITLTPPASGGPVVGTVMLPAGFTSAPRVALTAVTGTPGNVRISLNASPTASQFQVALDRTDGAFGTSIQWTATQGVDT